MHRDLIKKLKNALSAFQMLKKHFKKLFVNDQKWEK